MLRLSALYRFPLKSAKGESLPQARLDKLGLVGDRRWMLVDEASGRFLTQRADPKMSQLSALWNAAGGLTLNAQGFEALGQKTPAGFVHQHPAAITFQAQLVQPGLRQAFTLAGLEWKTIKRA